MRVVVPFGTKAPMLRAVQIALEQDGVEAQYEHMARPDSYFELMKRLWAARETVVIVEHDVVVWPGGVDQLAQCSEPWCTLPYYCSVGWIIDGLGCTKFADELMTEVPEMFEEPFPSCCSHHRDYCGLDRLIAHRLQQLGRAPHVHSPGVSNLNGKWTT